jgi:hypothetical protein
VSNGSESSIYFLKETPSWLEQLIAGSDCYVATSQQFNDTVYITSNGCVRDTFMHLATKRTPWPVILGIMAALLALTNRVPYRVGVGRDSDSSTSSTASSGEPEDTRTPAQKRQDYLDSIQE